LVCQHAVLARSARSRSERNGQHERTATALGRLTSAYTIGGVVGPALGGTLGVQTSAQLAVVGSLDAAHGGRASRTEQGNGQAARKTLAVVEAADGFSAATRLVGPSAGVALLESGGLAAVAAAASAAYLALLGCWCAGRLAEDPKAAMTTTPNQGGLGAPLLAETDRSASHATIAGSTTVSSEVCRRSARLAGQSPPSRG